MTEADLKALRLHRQHLTSPTDKMTAVRDLNGFQAQFLSNACHALRIRCAGPFPAKDWGRGLVKSWTIRGTMHVFAETDLPLYLYTGREHFLRACDTAAADDAASAERKAYFTAQITELIAQGTDTREALRNRCFERGMTEAEARSIFDPWGGLIRCMAEQGLIAYRVQEKKAFLLCPPFRPMEKEDALAEILSRYFYAYGPATLRDAAYYLGKPQSKIAHIMEKLPLSSIETDKTRHSYMGALESNVPDIPDCVFLAGFDPLLLGYEKAWNPFLPGENLRGVFSLAGIVSPCVLLKGRVVAKWKKKGGTLSVALFEPVGSGGKRTIANAAEAVFPDLVKLIWE